MPLDRVAQVELALDHVVPGRRVGVLEVGHEPVGARVQRVDDHLAVGRPGDLHPALLAAGSGAGATVQSSSRTEAVPGRKSSCSPAASRRPALGARRQQLAPALSELVARSSATNSSASGVRIVSKLRIVGALQLQACSTAMRSFPIPGRVAQRAEPNRRALTLVDNRERMRITQSRRTQARALLGRGVNCRASDLDARRRTDRSTARSPGSAWRTVCAVNSAQWAERWANQPGARPPPDRASSSTSRQRL